MDNKEKITYLVLKTFYDNIPHNKHFGLKFLAIWMMSIAITGVLLKILPIPSIISLLLFMLFCLFAMMLLADYDEIKDMYLSSAINDDYIEKVMDKIKHQFSFNNNIHLKDTSAHAEYPEDVQVVINDLINNLTSKQDLATYHDIIKLYTEKAEKYEEHEEQIKKHEQTEMMEKYVK
jgi:hypothetical protein